MKIRLQTQENSRELMYRNFFQASRRIVREEGFLGWRGGLLFPGIVPSVMREFGYSSFRFGMYPIVKQKLGMTNTKQDVGLGKKICAGLITGGLGSALATPTDLVKIRQQKEAGRLGPDGRFLTGLRQGHKPMYRSTIDAFRSVFKEEGVRGLYTGVAPTMARAACLAAGQLASYDHTKYLLGRPRDDIFGHIAASLVAGLCATTAAQPFDTIKSRVMADRSGMYSGMFDCCKKTLRREGFLGLYTGWFTSYLRLGPHFIIAMPLWEQCRVLFGLDYL